MKRTVLIGLALVILIIGYSIYKRYTNTQVYKNYLQSVGIPAAVYNAMSYKELIATFKYLKQYAKDGQHLNIDTPNYNLLSDIRIKYGIFS